MNLSLSSEQELFRDSVSRFTADHYGFQQWRAIVASSLPFDRSNWRRMADMGWLGIGLSEEAGGTGGNINDLLIVMEGIGRGLMLEPYVSSVVLAGQILDHAGAPARQDVLPAIVSGDALVCVAFLEPGQAFRVDAVSTVARRDDTTFVLTGRKCHVLDAGTADWIIVSARMEAGGISLFIVPANAQGMQRNDYRGPDQRSSSDLDLDAVRVADSALLAAPPPQGTVLLARALDLAIIARLAEAIGCMVSLHDLTLDYLKTRKQFGVLIGSFQVLQHRMVDIAMACEEARSLLLFAAAQLDTPASERAHAVSAAKVRICQLATFVGHQAVQLHGAVAMAEELAVGHYLKRLLMIRAGFGSIDEHRDRFAATRPAL